MINCVVADNEPDKIIRMPKRADDYAKVLYAALRELDSLQLDIILVEQPPETEQWRAINDRLCKATSLQCR